MCLSDVVFVAETEKRLQEQNSPANANATTPGTEQDDEVTDSYSPSSPLSPSPNHIAKQSKGLKKIFDKYVSTMFSCWCLLLIDAFCV